MHRGPVHRWSIRTKRAVIMRISSYLPLQRHLLVSHLISMGYENFCQVF
jgi:hypothetical protein